MKGRFACGLWACGLVSGCFCDNRCVAFAKFEPTYSTPFSVTTSVPPGIALVGLLATEISNLRSTKIFLSPNVIRYYHPPRRESAPLCHSNFCVLRGKQEHHNSGTARVTGSEMPLPSLGYFAPLRHIALVTRPGTLR